MLKKDNSFEDRLEQYIQAAKKEQNRKAEVEVLLDRISISVGSKTNVYPSNCPGKGRKSDILLDENGEAACVSKGKNCKYFSSSEFKLQDYTKKIICKVM